MKKLKRSTENRMICGVCAGIAEYFNVDATLVRLIWIAVSLLSAGMGGVITYIIAAIVIPEN